MTRHLVRLASASDLDALLSLFEARVDWIVDRHRSDQWSSVGRWRRTIQRNIAVGATRVLCSEGTDDEIVGTVTLSRHGDPEFWGRSPEGGTGRALYLAKLATDPRRAGERLGDLLLDWAVDLAHRAGLHQVRLDAWKTAPGLHRFYRDRGWTQLDTVDVPGRMSGALFTRAPREIDLSHLLELTGGRRSEFGAADRWSAFTDDRYLSPRTAVGLVSDDALEWQTTELPLIFDEPGGTVVRRAPVPLG